MGLSAAALLTTTVAVVAVSWLIHRRRRQVTATPPLTADILVAACDLDKTVYPPSGPKQATQLACNVKAMAAFEQAGGFVFPVTGNNIPQAQVKFTDAAGLPLRDLALNPGIFCNGSLVLGPGGVEIERNGVGRSRTASGKDYVTALLDFFDAQEHLELLDGVGLMFFMPDRLVCVDRYDMDGYRNVEAFCKSQRVVPTRLSRAQIMAEHELVLQIVFLFPPLAEPSAACYEVTCRPRQEQVERAMCAFGLMDCSVPGAVAQPDGSGLGIGIKLTLMKDPWPEMDICCGGVDKGSALARFLTHSTLRLHLGTDCIDPARHVAVFGDAANDVPMVSTSPRPPMHCTAPNVCVPCNYAVPSDRRGDAGGASRYAACQPRRTHRALYSPRRSVGGTREACSMP